TADWVSLTAGKTLALAELAVRRVTENRGLVRDTRGRPVPGAAVTFSEPARRVETTTDENGAFRLSDIADGGALFFVRKNGKRFYGGRYAMKSTGLVEIVLESPQEAPVSAFTIVGRQGNLEERKARALKFLEQALDAKGDDANEKEQDRMRTL